MNRDEMIKTLLGGTWNVTFRKINGEERIMTCTRRLDMIPEAHHPKGTGKPENLDVVKAFDINAQGWRSFRVDSVISFGSV